MVTKRGDFRTGHGSAGEAQSCHDAPASMRVDVAKLGNLINMVGGSLLAR